MLFKIAAVKIFVNFTGTLCQSLFPESLKLYYKEIPTQIVSCKICEIFKGTFFYRSPPVATF